MMSKNRMNKKTKGFTLIELMIVIAVVGILAAIAYPSYQESLKKGRRSDAQGVLMGLAGAMERHYTNNNSYIGAGTDGADFATGDPTIYATESPLDGSAKYYDLDITVATANTYTLQATAKNAQVGDGVLQLTHTGVKSWDRNDDGVAGDGADDCWAKTC